MKSTTGPVTEAGLSCEEQILMNVKECGVSAESL